MDGIADSELLERWLANKAAIDKARRNPVRKQELLRDRDSLRIEWSELVERKRKGEITDTTFIDIAISTAKGVNLSFGIHLDYQSGPGLNNVEHLPLSWLVTAVYSGPEQDFTEKRLHAYAIAATKEMLEMEDDFLLRWGERDDEEDAETANSPERFVSVGQIIATGRACVNWGIDPWLWSGPDPRWMEPNHRMRR